MYSTCLYCSHDLGANAVIETLPIGRRIAFDESTGRLWVVCRGCEKWNLVPFDSRLETIDACEKLFREAKLMFSTDNIGIARLTEGLTLVWVGRAERQEFAAWRYGDQFGRRRRTAALSSGGAVIGVLALTAFNSHFRLIAGTGFSFQALVLGGNTVHDAYKKRRIAASIPDRDGSLIALTKAQVDNARFSIHGDGAVRITVTAFESAKHGFAMSKREQHISLDEPYALAALGHLMPASTRPAARDGCCGTQSTLSPNSVAPVK